MITTANIRTRKSVRTFSGEPLRQEDAQKITAFAETADNPYGLPIRGHCRTRKQQGVPIR